MEPLVKLSELAGQTMGRRRLLRRLAESAAAAVAFAAVPTAVASASASGAVKTTPHHIRWLWTATPDSPTMPAAPDHCCPQYSCTLNYGFYPNSCSSGIASCYPQSGCPSSYPYLFHCRDTCTGDVHCECSSTCNNYGYCG